MWKAIQEQIQSVPSQTSEEESSVDLKYNDLVQENSILKQELTDLYEHLTIVDDTTGGSASAPANSKMSSMGRLIVYNKSKHDTEMLMKHEDLRQKVILLEKELSYQTSHMKEQVLKIKDVEGKLKIAQAKLLTSDAETVAAVSLRQKVLELKGQLSSQAQELHTTVQRNGELKTQHDKDAANLEAMSGDLHQMQQQLTGLKEQLHMSSVELKDIHVLNSSLSSEHSHHAKKVEEQDVLLMKQQVDLMTSQTENKHLERKIEAQSKELLKLYESVSNLRATVTQRELELSKEREKVCARCTGSTYEVETDETTSSLMRGGRGVVMSNHSTGGVVRNEGKGNSRADGGRVSRSNTSSASGNVNKRATYRKVSSEGSEHGREINNNKKRGGGRRVEKEGNTIGEQPLLFGDEGEEDCLCVFFPAGVK